MKSKFPRTDFKKLGPVAFSKKGSQSQVVLFGPNGGEIPIFKKDGVSLLKNFTDKYSKSLGPSAEQILAKDRDTIQDHQQRLNEAIRQQMELENITAEKKRQAKNSNSDTENFCNKRKVESTSRRTCGKLENEKEVQRLKLLKNNYETS